eukprot:CFRG6091T1
MSLKFPLSPKFTLPEPPDSSPDTTFPIQSNSKLSATLAGFLLELDQFGEELQKNLEVHTSPIVNECSSSSQPPTPKPRPRLNKQTDLNEKTATKRLSLSDLSETHTQRRHRENSNNAPKCPDLNGESSKNEHSDFDVNTHTIGRSNVHSLEKIHNRDSSRSELAHQPLNKISFHTSTTKGHTNMGEEHEFACEQAQGRRTQHVQRLCVDTSTSSLASPTSQESRTSMSTTHNSTHGNGFVSQKSIHPTLHHNLSPPCSHSSYRSCPSQTSNALFPTKRHVTNPVSKPKCKEVSNTKSRALGPASGSSNAVEDVGRQFHIQVQNSQPEAVFRFGTDISRNPSQSTPVYPSVVYEADEGPCMSEHVGNDDVFVNSLSEIERIPVRTKANPLSCDIQISCSSATAVAPTHVFNDELMNWYLDGDSIDRLSQFELRSSTTELSAGEYASAESVSSGRINKKSLSTVKRLQMALKL